MSEYAGIACGGVVALCGAMLEAIKNTPFAGADRQKYSTVCAIRQPHPLESQPASTGFGAFADCRPDLLGFL